MQIACLFVFPAQMAAEAVPLKSEILRREPRRVRVTYHRVYG